MLAEDPMLEDELRKELASWAAAAHGLPVPASTGLRRRVLRRRIRVTGAIVGAAAAAAVISVVAVLVPAGAKPEGNALAWAPAGTQPAADVGPNAAPYYVSIRFQQDPVDALVVNWATGKTVAVVAPPAISGQGGFQAVEAAGDDRTFVLAAASSRAGLRDNLYELRLRADGKPLPLTLMVRQVRLSQPGSFAVSPDGRALALAIGPAARTIEVMRLGQPRTREWMAAGGSVGELAWAGNRELAFTWQASSQPGSALRLLDTRASGSDLLAARQLVRPQATYGGYGDPRDPLASADGSTIFVTMRTVAGHTPLAELMAVAVQTGTVSRVVLPPVGESGIGTWCGALWSSPSGRSLVASCGWTQGLVTGGQATLRKLTVPVYNESIPRPDFIAW
jgi:hypothetical protein